MRRMKTTESKKKGQGRDGPATKEKETLESRRRGREVKGDREQTRARKGHDRGGNPKKKERRRKGRETNDVEKKESRRKKEDEGSSKTAIPINFSRIMAKRRIIPELTKEGGQGRRKKKNTEIPIKKRGQDKQRTS